MIRLSDLLDSIPYNIIVKIVFPDGTYHTFSNREEWPWDNYISRDKANDYAAESVEPATVGKYLTITAVVSERK